MITRYVNTASTAGGDGTTNGTLGANRAFASIQTAESFLRGSNFNDDLEILCCGSAEDTFSRVGFIWNSYVTVSHTVLIKANRNDLTGYHGGKWNSGTYRIRTTDTSNPGFWLDDGWSARYFNLDGIQFEKSGSSSPIIQYDGSPTYFLMKDCLVKTSSGIGAHGIVINGHASLTGGGSFQNCIISTSTANPDFSGFNIQSGNGVWEIYNCLAQGFGGATSGANFKVSGTCDVTIKNTSSFNSRDDFSLSTSGSKTIDHCASDDGDGTNPVSIASWASQFYNPSYIVDVDYRIKVGTSLYNAGVGPSTDANVPSTDIVGDTRSGATSSVGAFQNRVCNLDALHGSTGGQYWLTKCLPSKHYVKYSRSIADNPGTTGLRGVTGVGVPGITGAQGVTGELGITGVQGVTGLGLNGATGVQGPTGLLGSTGVRGELGRLPGVTGILQFSFDGGETSIQAGYRAQVKLPYNTVFQAWEAVLGDTGTFVTELSVGAYNVWASAFTMNTGDTGPHVIDGVKDYDIDLTNWAGTTGSYGEYVQVNVLQSTVKQASVALKHYEKR